ncbi:hypothetical protein [Streptomyces sp. NPDC021356]|uniref:hypothetical protein n=1 Tax=Streptomyces sp. NPDC021356 TaxID=3154900 RepID=UPI0033CE297E
MPSDPYAVLRALVRAEAARSTPEPPCPPPGEPAGKPHRPEQDAHHRPPPPPETATPDREGG